MFDDLKEIFGTWTVTRKGTGNSNRFTSGKVRPITWYIEQHSISGRRRAWITNGVDREEADVVHVEMMSNKSNPT